MSEITVYPAKKIITMDLGNPVADHVAVRGGRILACGNKEDVSSWGPQTVDDRYADKIIMPGLVEGHAHVMAGGIWQFTYAGFHDRTGPDGRHWPGIADMDQMLDRLSIAEGELSDPETPLIAWGFDPIFFSSERLNRHHLDKVSATRPIAVIHSNFHLLTANSPALSAAQYGPGTNITGVALDDDGNPNGELQEMAAMFPVMRRLGIDFAQLSRNEQGILDYGVVARQTGVTTITDLYSHLEDEDLTQLLRITGQAAFPVRLVPALNALTAPAHEIAERAIAIGKKNTAKLRLGAVKLMTDGSIQGFTAQIREPGYFKGPNNAIWNMPPEQMDQTIDLLHRSGLQMHIHVNGDLASEVAIDALEATLSRHPRGDHRHVLQHCQLIDQAQFARMKALGLCANIFSNHIFYFGDQHRDITLGPDRARRMNAARSAIEAGVPFAIHSDAPVTPLGPLFTAWCAVNRLTGTGQVLGPYQRISVATALRTITIGAAYTLKMDHEIGSIEAGKRADFCILDEDPLSVPPRELKDTPIHGTVLDGQPTGSQT